MVSDNEARGSVAELCACGAAGTLEEHEPWCDGGVKMTTPSDILERLQSASANLEDALAIAESRNFGCAPVAMVDSETIRTALDALKARMAMETVG